MNAWIVVMGSWVANLTLVSYLAAKTIRRDRVLGYGVAVGLYVAWILVAQVMAAKLVEFSIMGWSFIIPAAAIMFPFAFQATDLINEAYGLRYTRYAILTAFATQVAAVLFFWHAIELPAAPFWELQGPFEKILGVDVPRIIAASWISFLVNENVDAQIFHWLRQRFAGAWWLRSTVSDTVGLVLDSAVFITLAFYGTVPGNVLLTMIASQAAVKWLFGMIDTPWFYAYRRWLYSSSYEGFRGWQAGV